MTFRTIFLVIQVPKILKLNRIEKNHNNDALIFLLHLLLHYLNDKNVTGDLISASTFMVKSVKKIL